jgi:hypothetical protein
MNQLLVAFMGVALSFAVGCSDSGRSDKASAKDMSAADACGHCPGIQKANPDGTCPACGMPVAEPTSSAAPSHHRAQAEKSGAAVSAVAGDEDQCTHCAGVQKANSDGKCPECGMDLAKK